MERSRDPRRVLRRLVVLAPIGLVLACWGSSAQGAVTHEYIPGISAELSRGAPAGPGVVIAGGLSGVNAMTLDAGHMWIAEKIEGQTSTRVDEFSASTGVFEAQLPQVASLEGVDNGVGVGGGTGEREVYVGASEGGKGVVGVFGPLGGLQHAWGGAHTPNGSFTEAGGVGVADLTGVAVDDSTNTLADWAAGDVYVVTAALSGQAGYNVVDVFKPVAGGAEPAKVVAQLEGTCVPPKTTCPGEVVPFSAPSGVAVSAFTGDVLVTDAKRVVDVFEPTALGEYAFVAQITGAPVGGFEAVDAVTADGGNGDIYIAESSSQMVDQFNAAGTYQGHLTGTPSGVFTGLQSLAVDPSSHDVYVGDLNVAAGTGVVDVFGASLVIPTVSSGEATERGARAATLNGTINPEGQGEATCQFAWGPTVAFGQIASCPAVGEGSTAVARQVRLTGLEPDSEYCYRMQSASVKNGLLNPGETQQTVCFTTLGPGLGKASVSDVSAGSATFEGTVNPHGAPTSYYFQYGRSSTYENGDVPAAPGSSIGSGTEPVPLAPQHVEGLSPATVYHYRLVVVSEVEGKLEEFFEPDQTFTTSKPATAGTLADGRQWELVSPADKHGALISGIGEAGALQSSLTGDAITYLANNPTETGVKGYFEEVQVLSSRGPGGWSSKDLALPHSSATGATGAFGHEYRYFSEDLSAAIAEPIGAFTSLAPEVSPPDTERTPYLRHNSTCAATPETCFQPLVTSAAGFADVPPGTEFGGSPEKPLGNVRWVGATSDLTHEVVSSTAALTSTSTSVREVLYEWSANKPTKEGLQVVSVLPPSEGGTPVTGLLGEHGDFKNVDARHAVSGDGSRVFWSQTDGGQHLYLRDTAKGETVRLDVVQAGGSGEGSVTPRFQLADSSGSVVFFTDEQQLTVGSGAGTGHADLYECVIVEAAGGDGCVLSDVTPRRLGQSAGVRGLVTGSSGDGSYVYFVGSGAIGGVNGRGEAPVAGGANLYMLHYDSTLREWEAPVLVGVLSGEDSPDWGTIEGKARLNGLTGRVSGGGQFLVFMSDRSLTGYDNRDVSSGVADEEVFLFDASSGRVVCVSCNPSGGRPMGVEYTALSRGPAGGVRVWENGVWLAANVPGWTPFEAGAARYQSRYLSDEGRVFFNSSDALVSQDVNHGEDVYEFEPAGVGSCSAGSSSYSPVSGGCVSLVSSGTAVGESAFLDASADGSDVFFLTAGQLVPGDSDTAFDVYDAHVCSASSPCTAPVAVPPVCSTADACRSAASGQPSIFGSPASATFSGAGNPPPPAVVKPKPLTQAQKLAAALKACHKDRVRHKRAVCERQAHKRYRVKKTHKATTRGRRRR